MDYTMPHYTILYLRDSRALQPTQQSPGQGSTVSTLSTVLTATLRSMRRRRHCVVGVSWGAHGIFIGIACRKSPPMDGRIITLWFCEIAIYGNGNNRNSYCFPSRDGDFPYFLYVYQRVIMDIFGPYRQTESRINHNMGIFMVDLPSRVIKHGRQWETLELN